MISKKTMQAAEAERAFEGRTIASGALAALILLKLLLLAAIGPLSAPDTGGFAAIADAMRSGVYWDRLDPAGRNAATLTARMGGYPAVLAASEWIAGPAASWTTALLQIALGILAVVALYHFALALLGKTLPALLVAAAYATGLPLVLDQTILTDGSYASVLVIFLSLLGRAALLRMRVTLLRGFLIGTLPAAALLLRESTVQFMLCMLPVLGVFAYAVRTGFVARLAVVATLLLPLLIAALAVASFNHWRTGTAFLSAGLRTALLVPLVQMQARSAPVFDVDDPTARALRAEIKEWRNEEIYGAVRRAEQRLRLSPTEMAGAVRAFFLRSIAAHPRAYATYVLRELRPRYFALSVAPAASFGTILASRKGELLSASQSIPTKMPGKLLALAAYGASAVIAGICWLAMSIGVPTLTILRGTRGIGIELALLLGLAACHLGMLILFALVHIEARYLATVQFVPPLAAAYLWVRASAHGRSRQARTLATRSSPETGF